MEEDKKSGSGWFEGKFRITIRDIIFFLSFLGFGSYSYNQSHVTASNEQEIMGLKTNVVQMQSDLETCHTRIASLEERNKELRAIVEHNIIAPDYTIHKTP